MSMSDAALVAIRELYRANDIGNIDEAAKSHIDRAIESLERYAVVAMTPIMKAPSTPEQIDRAIDVLDDYIKRTLDDWSDNVQSRLDDFNVIAHGLFTGTKVEFATVESRERES